MSRKYHNHTLQTNPGHRDEEKQNTNGHTAARREPKQSIQPSFPQNKKIH